jgi:O-glycosyl hydrolase
MRHEFYFFVMKKRDFFLAIIAIVSIVSCSKSKYSGPSSDSDPCFVNGVDTCNSIKPKIVLNLNDEKQVMENFGASDGWGAKYFGKWADVQKKNQIADYLFSTDTSSTGQPKGIGLTLWRFNIGAGSFEQGTASGIPDEFRREECFLKTDGTYDWTKQAGAQWFLAAAKQRGVNNFLAFALSPPVQYTLNNKAYGSGTSQYNLKAANKSDFSDFLVNVVQHFNQAGYNFNYLSPINEPQYNWGDASSNQEGSGATNTDIAEVVKNLGPKLKSANSPTKISIGEAGHWDYLNLNNASNRSNQLSAFFSPNSATYIGNVDNLDNMLSSHSYFTTCPDNSIINVRKDVLAAKNAINPNLRLWQTEFGILGNICGNYNGYPKNTTIDYGLYVAKVIHHDLAMANVSAWQWWLAMSPYNYSDALVYVNDASGGYDLTSAKTTGVVTDSKQLWCLGNYSRFIRPGMIRIGASLTTVKDDAAAAATQMVTAYKDKVNKKFVIVIVNMEAASKKFIIDTSSISLVNNKIAMYTTNDVSSLAKSNVDANNVLIPGKSVITLIGNYK